MKASLRHVLTIPAHHQSKDDLFRRIEESNHSNDQISQSSYGRNNGMETPSSSSAPSPGLLSTPYIKSSKIKIMEVHPCSPTLVAFVDSDPLDTSGSNLQQSEKQRIVLQDYYTDTTVLTLTLPEIAKQCLIASLAERDESVSSDNAVSERAVLQTAQNMGSILSLRFLDKHTVHWNMRAGMTPCSAENFDLNALIIQFHSRIVVYSIGPVPPFAEGPIKKKSNTNNHMILADITSLKLNKSMPTSTAIPILTSFVLAIGCSDGTMRFYDMITKKLVKSVRGPNGRNDPVVKIVAVNGYNYSSPRSHTDTTINDLEAIDKSMSSISLQKRDNSDVITLPNVNNRKTTVRSRVLAVCSAGSAFLWELNITMDQNDVMEKFRIKPPQVRLDGWGKTFSESMYTNTSGTGLLSTTSAKTGSVENTSVVYDPDRDFLIWSTPFGYGGSFKPHVVVWDLSPSSLPGGSSKLMSGDSSMGAISTPLHEPFLVLQIPNSSTGTIVGGDNDIHTDLTLVSGILHPSFSDSTLITFVGGKSGDLAIMTASCSIASSLVGRGAKSKGNETQFQKAETHYQCSLPYLRTLVSNKDVLGNLNKIPASKIRLHALAVSRFHPNLVLMKTNAGIAVINIAENNTLVAGTRHVPLSQGSGMSSGHGFSSTGPGIILVENSSVFTATLDSTSSNNEHTPVGPVPFKDPVLVYKSPNLHGDTLETHVRRLPPRLLYSPSGNFLCLFWYAEHRYEILHVGSILRTSRRQNVNGGDYVPAVDSGGDVLSFAWVGDEDVFALLHPPALSKDASADGSLYSSTSGTHGKDKKGLKKELKKLKSTVNKLATNNQNASTSEAGDDDTVADPSHFQPSVELKVLIGTIADAVEISGSVAAATSISLGDITLRGGVRHPPTILFGGPVLCVGSLTQDIMDDTQSDGMAFFYSRKSSADGNDNVRNSKASSYQSIGPPLPYPDLVVWDDVGRLCAVIVGRRIAIYLADPPRFIFLGSVYLGTQSEPDATAESAKFLHGTLYCSTRSTVQCIFLGDLDNDDNICEIDSYSLTSNEGPSFASSPFPVNGMFISENTEFQPIPYPMALNQPSILMYNNGSLIVSTVSGIQAVSISHPLIRIGNLIGAGYHGRAQKWFDAIDEFHHESLAAFLDKRGAPELAVNLPGLSLETKLDFCLRYGYVEQLENLVDYHGVGAIRQIDMGRSFRQGVPTTRHSLVVCIGTYLLSQGKAEKVRRLASECMKYGEEGRKDSFILATLLLPIDAPDAKRLIKRAVGKKEDNDDISTEEQFNSWPIGAYVRDYLLKD